MKDLRMRKQTHEDRVRALDEGSTLGGPDGPRQGRVRRLERSLGDRDVAVGRALDAVADDDDQAATTR
jgi:hypothetical protein